VVLLKGGIGLGVEDIRGFGVVARKGAIGGIGPGQGRALRVEAKRYGLPNPGPMRPGFGRFMA
jgi:hypothetical protein